jgi:hypothetical protein
MQCKGKVAPRQFHIRDVGSVNGTFVNGNKKERGGKCNADDRNGSPQSAHGITVDPFIRGQDCEVIVECHRHQEAIERILVKVREFAVPVYVVNMDGKRLHSPDIDLFLYPCARRRWQNNLPRGPLESDFQDRDVTDNQCGTSGADGGRCGR